MTRRLALAGFAAVAVLWGPYLYSEWSRDPMRPAPEDSRRPADGYEPVTAEPLAQVVHAETELAAATAEPPEAPEATAEPEAVGPPPELAEAAMEEANAPALPPPAAEPAAPAAAQGAAPPSASPPLAAAQAVPSEPVEEEEAATEAPATKEADKPAASPEALAPAYRSAFDREARDAAWAGHEETRLTSLLSTAGVPDALVSEVRCQSTVCRISFSAGAAPPELRTALLQRAQSELGPRFALDTSPMAESESHASLYVLRKGYDLEAR